MAGESRLHGAERLTQFTDFGAQGLGKGIFILGQRAEIVGDVEQGVPEIPIVGELPGNQLESSAHVHGSVSLGDGTAVSRHWLVSYASRQVDVPDVHSRQVDHCQRVRIGAVERKAWFLESFF